MTGADLQVSFFGHLKKQLPPHIAIVDEISDTLNISIDSAYRRLRGEKPLTFDEIHLLAKKYNVSLDQFLHLQPVAVLFSGNYIEHDDHGFENYLQNIVRQLSVFEMANEKEMVFFNKDIPLPHHFIFPELAAFKCYFWSRYNLNNPRYNRGQFLIEDFIDIFNTYVGARPKVFLKFFF
jgi:transcriptional regulator with XRE-family HTH domain